jgi:hypothetical protein
MWYLHVILDMRKQIRVNEVDSNEQKRFFSIFLARNLLGKSIKQVLTECAAFDARLFTDNELSEYRIYSQVHAMVGFHCDFKLRDYQAFSIVVIRFVEDKAIECIISLGRPANEKRYSSEKEVTRVLFVVLEESYHNGRITDEGEPGTKAYTWKKDDRTIISFISYPPSGRITDTDVWLGIQIRDIQLHPQGTYYKLLYDRSQKI